MKAKSSIKESFMSNFQNITNVLYITVIISAGIYKLISQNKWKIQQKCLKYLLDFWTKLYSKP